MAKFKFRLATLLKLREAARDERRTQLAQAFRADEILQDHQDQVADEFDSLKKLCRKAGGPGSVDLDLLLESQRYEVVLKIHQRRLNEQRQQLALEIERRRAALLTANREVQILEKLREHQAREHKL
ncbi:MAG: hypothetical protein ACWGMZ_05005, partial [Thermoguttaceae bacterium]